MTVVNLPSTVSPGTSAGYRVTITNNGPSNIPALYLVDSNKATPTYLTSDRNACGTATGPLFCSFGALIAGSSVSITVGYATPTSGNSFGITFQANTSGVSYNDKKGTSHGDVLEKTATTGLSSNSNFAGRFLTSTGEVVSNSSTLTGNNKQATKVQGVGLGKAVTVQDGSTSGPTCDPAVVNCSKLFGEWSLVNVDGGATQGVAFQIVISYKTGTPSKFLHVKDDGSQEAVSPCAGNTAPTNNNQLPCFTLAGNTATIYTLQNGSWRGL
jgi:hypothetical protein